MENISASAVKVELKEKGWSYRRAAELIGVSHALISLTLNDKHDAPHVLALLRSLPHAPHDERIAYRVWRKNHGRN